MTMRQQALVYDIDRSLRREPFAHRRFRGVGLAGILERKRVIAKLTRGRDQRLGFRKRKVTP